MARRGLRILQGCLITIAVALVVLITLVLSFRAAGAPESAPRQAELEQPVPAVTERQLAAEGLDAGLGARASGMNVVMLLEEGDFTVEPGPPGSPIRVEGNYDAGTYDLKQEMVTGADGRPEYRLSFRPRYSILGRLLRQGSVHIEDGANRLKVLLPPDRRLALRAEVRKGRSELRLGGLALESATLDLHMGEHHVSAERPNPIEMSALEVRSGMGEIHLNDLGNLRAERIAAWGRMGEFHVDLGEAVSRDTRLFVRMKMGELTVGLPARARIHASTSVLLGEGRGLSGAGEEGSPDDPVVDVDASVTLGELRYVKN